jgi:hypothetical protein
MYIDEGTNKPFKIKSIPTPHQIGRSTITEKG